MAALMPPSATPLERALDAIGQRPETIPVEVVARMKDPARTPARLLAWLAWEYSVDDWPALEAGEAARRRAIAAAPGIHRIKGTPAALDAALGVFDFTARITEWFEATPEGRPYTFALDVEVRGRAITAADYDRALAVALRAKNLRSHLDRLTVRQTVDGAVIAAAATLTHETVSVFPPAPRNANGAAPSAILATALAGDCIQAEVDLQW